MGQATVSRVPGRCAVKRAKKPKCAKCAEWEELRRDYNALVVREMKRSAGLLDRIYELKALLLDRDAMLDAVCKALEREQRFGAATRRANRILWAEVNRMYRIHGTGKPWWKLSIGNILARMRAR